MVEWKDTKIGNIIIGKPAYGINAPACKYKTGLPHYIRITDIAADGKYSTEDLTYVDSEQSANYYLTDNDIVFARTGASVGKSYLYNSCDGELVFAGFLIKISVDPEKADNRYVYAAVNTEQFRNWVKTSSMRSGQPGINGEQYSSFSFLLPPLPEQHAIATALSDIDGYITTLERLIAKKRNIKKGAMQELLTGKRRLAGFDGTWVTKTWQDVLDGFSSGATPYRGRSDYYKGKVKWVSSGELEYRKIFETIEHISSTAQTDSSLTLHPVGTFLMAITGLEAGGTRGRCAMLGAEATTNQSCMAIYGTKKMNAEYLFHYYILNGDSLAFQFCQGTKQQSYTAKIVKALPIFFPESIREQIAIANILTNMDTEIDALTNKLSKLRNIKQGMMQELLTGRIRLIQEDSDDAENKRS